MDHEGGDYAIPSYEKLGEATSPKEFGKGGGELTPGESGPGVRLGKLQESSAANVRNAIEPRLTDDQLRRFKKYQELVDDLKGEKITDDEAKNRLEHIYESNRAHLEKGGFLAEDSKLKVIADLEARGELSHEEAEMLRALLADKKNDETPLETTWEATLEAIIKEEAKKPSDNGQ